MIYKALPFNISHYSLQGFCVPAIPYFIIPLYAFFPPQSIWLPTFHVSLMASTSGPSVLTDLSSQGRAPCPHSLDLYFPLFITAVSVISLDAIHTVSFLGVGIMSISFTIMCTIQERCLTEELNIYVVHEGSVSTTISLYHVKMFANL
jgi:hypothetical protein